MPNYVRARLEGGTYFFTVAARNRAPRLARAPVRAALREAISATRARWPFTVDAWVLLPDHLHCLWSLPEGDADFSKRWSTIKRLTT
jgi:putative transposase